jgi:hypothetical protein
MNSGSGAALGSRISAALFALLAELSASECADDADKSPTVPARVPFRRALLVVAGPANHRVAFAEDLAHSGDLGGDRVEGRTERCSGSVNLYHGPHLTTRFAAWHNIDSRSGPASSQPGGTGASRLFSPSLSKQSHPLLYSLATSTFRRNGPLRRSGVRRRSAKPWNSSPRLGAAARRSTLRLSAAAGVTSQTSHRLPVESRNVR